MRSFRSLVAITCVLGSVAFTCAQDGGSPPPLELDTAAIAPLDSDTAGRDAPAADQSKDAESFDSSEGAAAASNPLSSSSKVDLRLDYYDLDGSKDRFDYNIDAAVMLHPRLKLNFEVHYWNTNATGTWEDNFERVSLKPILFPADIKLNDTWQMRVAAGLEWIIDFDHADQGIGSGSDQLGPLFGLAFNNRDTGLTLIPLVQHFVSYDGPNVNTTALRLIALQPLPASMWLRLDLKIPIDRTNNTVPAVFETELGKMFSPNWGLFGTAFLGIGEDRPYDWGLGAAVRVSF